MSETKTIEELIDAKDSEATTSTEGPVSNDVEINNAEVEDNSNADASDTDTTSTNNSEGTDLNSTEPQNINDADAFQRTEDNTCIPMQLADTESNDSASDDPEYCEYSESEARQTKCARVPIRVYVHPNEKSRFYETTGTYHILGEEILNCFQKVICCVPGIGRVKGYIKVNGGR